MSEQSQNDNTQAAAPASEVPARRPEKHVTLFGAVLMQVIAVALALFGAYFLDNMKGDDVTVITADTAAIINTKLLDMQKQGLSEEEYAKQTQDFIKKMSVRLEEYRASGFMVVNEKAVVAAPNSVNVTSELAKYLGVNPNAVLQASGSTPSR